MVDVGVVVKVKEDPPSFVDKGVNESVAETTKSLATPVVAPLSPETEIVHTTGTPCRESALPVQMRLVAVVGVPNTVKAVDPLEIKALFAEALTRT